MYLHLIIDRKASNPNLMRSICRQQTWPVGDPVRQHEVRLLCMVVLETFLHTEFRTISIVSRVFFSY
jgi:hypothetical protein